MKVGILFRGPIRPSAPAVAARIRDFAKQFDANGVDYDIFVSTWNGQEKSEINYLQSKIEDANILLLKQPSESFIYSNLSKQKTPSGGSTRNAFWQYYMAKAAINLINSCQSYDYIVHTRTDIDFKFGEHFAAWFNSEKYNTIHILCDGFINDQFSVAQPDIMTRAWDYKDQKNLFKMIDDCDKPEDVLQAMVSRENIEAVRQPFALWELDGHRHSV